MFEFLEPEPNTERKIDTHNDTESGTRADINLNINNNNNNRIVYMPLIPDRARTAWLVLTLSGDQNG